VIQSEASSFPPGGGAALGTDDFDWTIGFAAATGVASFLTTAAAGDDTDGAALTGVEGARFVAGSCELGAGRGAIAAGLGRPSGCGLAGTDADVVTTGALGEELALLEGPGESNSASIFALLAASFSCKLIPPGLPAPGEVDGAGDFGEPGLGRSVGRLPSSAIMLAATGDRGGDSS